MTVLATAGHIDHGKSTILRALTGMEPSRLPQEKKRGMTMQLGYVWQTLPSGECVGFVDVPGHSDYAKAMLSGVSGVDGFIFAIACDDGFMPQTEEHLFILEQLKITNGLVVLTKTDLVDEAKVQELQDEAALRFEMALGRPIKVIPFASTDEQSQVQLKEAVNQLVGQLPKPLDIENPKLLIDRVFSPKGQGTVITGTLTDGSFKVGDVIQFTSSLKKNQIRQLHAYGEDLKSCQPISRLAINVSDLSVEAIDRGTHVGHPKKIYLTNKVDCEVFFRDKTYKRPKKTVNIEIGLAGACVKARLIPISGANDEGRYFARLKFLSKQWVRFGERLIVKTSDGQRTIAGAVVADEAPRHSVKKALALLSLLNDYNLSEYIYFNMEKNGSIPKAQIPLQTFYRSVDFEDWLDEADDLKLLEGYLVDPTKLDHVSSRLLGFLNKFHKDTPEAEGIPSSKLEKDLFLPKEFFTAVVNYLKGKSKLGDRTINPKLSQSGPNLKLAGFVPSAGDHQLSGKLQEISDSPKIESHSFLDLQIETKKDRSILRRFIDDKKIVSLGEKHLISAIGFKKASELVVQHLEKEGSTSTSELRDALGLGRKLVVMLLEQMDREKITLLDGNSRRLR
jgi:selenocysteine-specific elongation factor